MKEYIEREAIRNTLYEADAITMDGVKILNQFPAADVVEVVYCKDCKYADDRCAYGLVCCHWAGICGCFVADTDYCSSGERKDVDDG